MSLLTIERKGPLQLSAKIRYPPTYLILGEADALFDRSHLTDFSKALDEQGSLCQEALVPSVGHAFEIWADMDSDVHLKDIRPAVLWTLDHMEK